MPYALVVVANRLPVDVSVEEDGSTSWRRSPGGLVSALEPVMQAADGAWVGWVGKPDVSVERDPTPSAPSTPGISVERS